MPADLVPQKDIPDLAGKITSPAMLRVLRRLRERHFVQNAAGLDGETAAALRQLAELGLADPGYAGYAERDPFIWVSNGNGERVLRHLEKNPRYEVRIHPRAATALESLPAAERDAVLGSIETLKTFDPAAWPADDVLPLGWDGHEFMLSVSPDLRAFVRLVGTEAVEVYDVMRADTLKLFLEQQRAGGNAE